jgi:hypothetical protein
MKESLIERYLVQEIKGLGGLAWKFISPGTSGVPDRVVMLPGGIVWFVETKSNVGGRTNALQHLRGKQLFDIGCNYKLLSSKDAINTWLKDQKLWKK